MTSVQKEKFMQSVLQNEDLFFGLVHVLQKAGQLAAGKSKVLNAGNDVCMLPLEKEGLTRRVVPLGLRMVSPAIPTVNFDPRSITLVGGAAVQVYTHLQGRNAFYRQTSDIDAVWWPKILLPPSYRQQLASSATLVDPEVKKYEYIRQARKANSENNVADELEIFRFNYKFGTKSDMQYIDSASIGPLVEAPSHAVLSSSWAIQAMVQEYTKQLEVQLREFIKHRRELLEPLAREAFEYGEGPLVMKASTKFGNLFLAGISNVWGFIVIEGADGKKIGAVKCIEMTIHDGASSQRSNTLMNANTDVVYSIYNGGKYAPAGVDMGSYVFQIPLIDRLLDQQLFALEVREDSPNLKIQTTIYRIKYLYNLLKKERKVDKINKYEEEFTRLCTRSELKFLCEKGLEPALAVVAAAATATAPAPAPAPAPLPLTFAPASPLPFHPPMPSPLPPPTKAATQKMIVPFNPPFHPPMPSAPAPAPAAPGSPHPYMQPYGYPPQLPTSHQYPPQSYAPDLAPYHYQQPQQTQPQPQPQYQQYAQPSLPSLPPGIIMKYVGESVDEYGRQHGVVQEINAHMGTVRTVHYIPRRGGNLTRKHRMRSRKIKRNQKRN